jgi:hypothetical protein
MKRADTPIYLEDAKQRKTSPFQPYGWKGEVPLTETDHPLAEAE